MLPRLAAPVTGIAVAALLVLAAPAASAATGIVAVPPEPNVTILPGPATLHAAVGDLDGDGVRELVRLVGGPETDGRVLVEAWSLQRGAWRLAGDGVTLRRGTSVEEAFTERAKARTGSTPVLVGEPARIVAWHDGTRERLVVAALGNQAATVPCCLTLWEPVLDAGRLLLAPRNDANGPGERLHALDLDGDGVDELLMTQSQPATRTPGFVAALEAEAMAWDGAAFRTVDRRTFQQGGRSPVWAVGDTDRRPGAEVVLVQPGPGPAQLYRLGLDEGQLALESTAVPPLVSLVGVPRAGADALAYAAGGATFLATWTDGALDIHATSSTSGLLLPTIGGPAGERLPVARSEPLSLVLLDGALQRERTIEPTAAAALGSSLGVGGAAIGTLPGGDRRGRPAVVFAGRLLATPGANDQPYPPSGVSDVASMVGAQPVGLVGEGEWLAVLHGLGAPRDLERGGGLLRQERPSDPWLAIVPAELALAPELAAGRLAPSIDGAVVQPAADGAQRVIAPGAGFTAIIEAPPGSRVVPVAPERLTGEAAGGGVVPAEGRLELSVRPPSAAQQNTRFDAAALVLTPAGHAYTARWEVQVLVAPPTVAAEASTAVMSWHVTLDGRTAPGARLTVDGAPVAVGADGSFTASVAAPPWPRTVRLEATDAVGNSTVELLTVVGLFDYRTLPWLPIVALLTLAIGVLLLVRAPRAAPVRERYDRVEAGALEEIAGDDDGVAPP